MDTKLATENSIENVPEKFLSQPKDNNSGYLMYKSISLLNTIYEWQPVGVRFVLNLPIESNDIYPIFGIKVTPLIPHLLMESYLYMTPADAIRQFNSGWPFSIPNGTFPVNDSGFGSDARATVVQHSYPPFISQLAHMYRFWRGSLSYQFRTVSNFTNQAYTFFSTSHNIPHAMANIQNVAIEPINYPWNSHNFASYMNAAYVPNDLSIQRHSEVTVPYTSELPFVDTHSDIFLNGFADTATKVNAMVTNTYNWLGYFNRGTITGGGGTNQIMIELHMKAEQDFEFSGEVFPMAFPGGTADKNPFYGPLSEAPNPPESSTKPKLDPFYIPRKELQISTTTKVYKTIPK